MASSKVLPSTSNSRNSDLSLPSHHHRSPMISDFSPNSGRHRPTTTADLPSPVTVDGEITLIDAAGAISAIDAAEPSIRSHRKTVDDVWRDIVAGKSDSRKEYCKMEAPDEVMTLEDFLAKAGAEVEVDEDEVEDSKVLPPPLSVGGGSSGGGLFGFDHPLVQSPYPAPAPGMGEVGVMGFGNGGSGGRVEVVAGGSRGKRRGGPILEPLDKAAQQRQRRMIKNRESAARSRERKQAYQFELESLAVKLEEENEQLLREKAEWTKRRYKQLMEKVVPVVEKRKPPRVLRRVRSTQW